jgi:hypothetical protein
VHEAAAGIDLAGHGEQHRLQPGLLGAHRARQPGQLVVAQIAHRPAGQRIHQPAGPGLHHGQRRLRGVAGGARSVRHTGNLATGSDTTRHLPDVPKPFVDNTFRHPQTATTTA